MTIEIEDSSPWDEAYHDDPVDPQPRASRLRRSQSILSSFLILIASSSLTALPAKAAVTGTGLSIYYMNSGSWSTPPAAFTTGTCATGTGEINFNWGGSGPSGCNSDNFTAYANGYILAPFSGSIDFCEQTDDQFYMNLNGALAINDTSAKAAATGNSCNGTSSFTMVAGSSYPIDVWMHEMSGGAEWRLLWKYNGAANYSIVPLANLNPTAFVVPDVTLSFSAPTSATYRQSVNLTATSDAPGKITFFAAGRVIPGCKSLVAVQSGASYSSTCKYKASLHGQISLHFSIAPTNGANPGRSNTTTLLSSVRGSKR
ncbi:unannotated protein [freshwater metagenome]|uniref:Unannotated protein n=1 Tax=freshwater metagenome TaxID=449393 RepID=A0A6J7Q6D6_9ZZZZ|nr:hypothetical protein [Actinomycetota bacterium]